MMGNHIHSVMNPVPTLEEGEGDDGNHIYSAMNPVPTLEEEKGDDGEPHTFSNESSLGTGFITECMWFPIISVFFFQCRNWIHY
jgi:hypothetical protein